MSGHWQQTWVWIDDADTAAERAYARFMDRQLLHEARSAGEAHARWCREQDEQDARTYMEAHGRWVREQDAQDARVYREAHGRWVREQERDEARLMGGCILPVQDLQCQGGALNVEQIVRLVRMGVPVHLEGLSMGRLIHTEVVDVAEVEAEAFEIVTSTGVLYLTGSHTVAVGEEEGEALAGGVQARTVFLREVERLEVGDVILSASGEGCVVKSITPLGVETAYKIWTSDAACLVAESGEIIGSRWHEVGDGAASSLLEDGSVQAVELWAQLGRTSEGAPRVAGRAFAFPEGMETWERVIPSLGRFKDHHLPFNLALEPHATERLASWMFSPKPEAVAFGVGRADMEAVMAFMAGGGEACLETARALYAATQARRAQADVQAAMEAQASREAWTGDFEAWDAPQAVEEQEQTARAL